MWKGWWWHPSVVPTVILIQRPEAGMKAVMTVVPDPGKSGSGERVPECSRRKETTEES